MAVLIVFCGRSAAQRSYGAALDSYLDSLGGIYGAALSDSIWNHLLTDFPEYLENTSLKNFEFTNLNGEVARLRDLSKPIFFHITASWCRPCIDEIPAVNKLIATYSDRVAFVFLTHDTQERALELWKKYQNTPDLIPSQELIQVSKIVKLQIGDFKHIMPYPTTYLTDSNGSIKSVIVGGAAVMEGINTKQEVFDVTYEKFSKEIDQILLNGN